MSTPDDPREFIPGCNAAWQNFKDTVARQFHLYDMLDWLARLLDWLARQLRRLPWVD
jgi:hypothetical protein